MDNILSFLADNYKWFMLAAVLLLFALIGFIVDGKKKKKNEEVVPVPNADAQTQAATTVAPTTANASTEPAAPAPAATTAPAEEQGLVIEEPSLNNVEATSNEVNIDGVEEEGSIFGTPEMQAPASVETTAEDPAVTEGPTLVIEDKEESAQEMATANSETAVSEPAPKMAPAEPTPVVEPASEVVPTAPTPVVEPSPEVAPTAPEVPAAPETPSTPTTPVQ